MTEHLCRHCRRPILESTFSEGKRWWHLPLGRNNILSRNCYAFGDSPTAEPQELER